MYGSRLVTAARRWLPPAPGIAEKWFIDKELRDPVTSPPLPVPDRIARGQASPKAWPQLFGVRSEAHGRWMNVRRQDRVWYRSPAKRPPTRPRLLSSCAHASKLAPHVSAPNVFRSISESCGRSA